MDKVQRESGGVGETVMAKPIMLLVVFAVASLNASANTAQIPVVNNPLAKEGMALSRIALSPVNIIGHAYAQVEHYGSVGVALSPVFIVGAVPGGYHGDLLRHLYRTWRDVDFRAMLKSEISLAVV